MAAAHRTRVQQKLQSGWYILSLFLPFSRENIAGCTDIAVAPHTVGASFSGDSTASGTCKNRQREVTFPDAEALHGWIEGYRDLYEKFQDSQLKACTALPGYTGSNTTQQHEWNSV